MVARSLVRLSRSAPASSLSSQAGPSTSSSFSSASLAKPATSTSREMQTKSTGKQTQKPTTRRRNPPTLPRETLRNLVSLHHSSAAFMTSPTQLDEAFHNAFNTLPPQFEPYSQFEARSLAANRLGATSRQQLVAHKSTGTGIDKNYETMEQLKIPPRVFNRVKPFWSDMGAKDEGDYSSDRGTGVSRRQTQVQEALFGTWEREGGEAVRPGLEGVEEWLAARGVSSKKSAKAWNRRNEQDQEREQRDK